MWDSRRWQFHSFLFFYSSSALGPSPPSPPSPVNYPNERLQRQSAKLRKKLESRSNKTGSANVTANLAASSSIETPPSSPKKGVYNFILFLWWSAPDWKWFHFVPNCFLFSFSRGKSEINKTDNNNIRKLKDRNQNGMPEIGLPAAGQDHHHHHQQTEAANKKNDQEAMAERITELGAPQVCCRKSSNNN